VSDGVEHVFVYAVDTEPVIHSLAEAERNVGAQL
jgi:hypothetical protein